MGTDDNFWGDLVLQLREEQNVSQRKLAAGAKVHRATLRRIEEGVARAEIDAMERILLFLGYELEAVSALTKTDRIRRRAQEIEDPKERSALIKKLLLSRVTLG